MIAVHSSRLPSPSPGSATRATVRAPAPAEPAVQPRQRRRAPPRWATPYASCLTCSEAGKCGWSCSVRRRGAWGAPAAQSDPDLQSWMPLCTCEPPDSPVSAGLQRRRRRPPPLPADGRASPLRPGLDAAGKTTILYKLHIGEVLSTVPTIGFNVEKVRRGVAAKTAVACMPATLAARPSSPTPKPTCPTCSPGAIQKRGVHSVGRGRPGEAAAAVAALLQQHRRVLAAAPLQAAHVQHLPVEAVRGALRSQVDQSCAIGCPLSLFHVAQLPQMR